MNKKLTKRDIKAINDVIERDSYILVFYDDNGNEVHYIQRNMDNKDAIAALEVTKAIIVKKCNKGIK